MGKRTFAIFRLMAAVAESYRKPSFEGFPPIRFSSVKDYNTTFVYFVFFLKRTFGIRLCNRENCDFSDLFYSKAGK